jgi:low temperature requirement protein LtrA
MSQDRGLLRTRHGHAHHRVGFVELFFDLVFVFAITQLSHSLIEHFSIIGAIETALLTLAVWWVWIYTVWATNWLDPEKLPVRVLLLAMMLPGLIVSAAIPQAFEARGLWFAGAYVSIQLGRTLFFLWAVAGHEHLVRTFRGILVWMSVSGLVWIAGAFVEHEARLAVWGVAYGLDFIAPATGFWVPGLGRSVTADWNVEGGHVAERCGLFVIIALGESLLVTGATFSNLPWTTATVAAMCASVLGSVAMWWLYFDTTAETGTRTIAGSEDPGRLARLAYTYIHLLLVAGIILSAVGDEFVLAHADGHTDARTAIAVLGGPALFLLGNWLFKWSIAGQAPISTLVAVAALGALAVAASQLAPVVLMIASVMVLIAIAAWEARVRHLCPPVPAGLHE